MLEELWSEWRAKRIERCVEGEISDFRHFLVEGEKLFNPRSPSGGDTMRAKL